MEFNNLSNLKSTTMCTKVSTLYPNTAVEDIICYKQLTYKTYIDRNKLKHNIMIVDVHTKDDIIKGCEFATDTNTISVKRNKYHTYILPRDLCLLHFMNDILFEGESICEIKLVTKYQRYPIEIGKCYTSTLDSPYLNRIDIGLHSFQSLTGAKDISEYDHLSTHFAIAECIIPKGSIYYEGEFLNIPSYVSDRLEYIALLGDNRTGGIVNIPKWNAI